MCCMYTVYSGVQEWVIQIPSIPILVSVLFPSLQYASKKPVRICAQSRVAAVHINSRLTLRTPTHVDRTVLAQPSVHRERRAAKAWYSNSRGMGLLKRWVDVRLACLPLPVQP